MRRRILSDDQVRMVLTLHVQQHMTITDIARALQLGQATVSLIVLGRSYQHITGGVNLSRSHAQTGYRRALLELRRAQNPDISLRTLADELGISREGVRRLAATTTPPAYAVRQSTPPRSDRDEPRWADARWYTLTPGYPRPAEHSHVIVTTTEPGHALELPAETYIFACDNTGRLTQWGGLFGSPFALSGDHAAALKLAGYLLVDEIPHRRDVKE